MPVIPIVGEMGSGKTTWAKQERRRFPKRQARALTFKPQDFKDENFKIYVSLTDFIQDGCRMANQFDVLDEGKTFLPIEQPMPKQVGGIWRNEPIIEYLAGSREYNRYIVIIFHTIKELRERMWILEYTKAFHRFNTKDKLNIESRCFSSFPNIVNNLEKVNTIPKFQYYHIPVRS